MNRDNLGRMRAHQFVLAMLIVSLVIWLAPAFAAEDDLEQRDLVDQSPMTLSNFLADSNMT